MYHSPMTRYDNELLSRLERTIVELEAGTRVELVLVLAHRAEAYRDVPYKVGGLAALLLLLLMVYLPHDFSVHALAPTALIGAGVAFWFGRGAGWPTRLLTCPRRREESVRRATRTSFVERGVSLTRERTGLLVLVSWLERRVEVLADVGIEQKIPAPEWNAALRALQELPVTAGFPSVLERGLQPLHQLLIKYLPVAEDNPDELPNRPVVIG